MDQQRSLEEPESGLRFKHSILPPQYCRSIRLLHGPFFLLSKISTGYRNQTQMEDVRGEGAPGSASFAASICGYHTLTIHDPRP